MYICKDIYIRYVCVFTYIYTLYIYTSDCTCQNFWTKQSDVLAEVMQAKQLFHSQAGNGERAVTGV